MQIFSQPHRDLNVFILCFKNGGKIWANVDMKKDSPILRGTENGFD